MDEKENLMPNDFDEAADMSQMYFNPQEEQPAEELPPEQEELPPQNPLPQETQPPQVPTIEQILQQMTMLQTQNQELMKVIQQMSSQQQERVVETATEPQMPELALPELNIDYTYDDEETIKGKHRDYTQRLLEYAKEDAKRDVLRELAPIIDASRQGLNERRRSDAVNMLSNMPELQGFNDSLPILNQMLDNNKIFSAAADAPLEDKYVMAYFITKGMDAVKNAGKQMTPDDFIKLYQQNPEYERAINAFKLGQVKPNQEIPSMSASSGAVNAALNMPEKPKNFDEANEMIKNLFFKQ